MPPWLLRHSRCLFGFTLSTTASAFTTSPRLARMKPLPIPSDSSTVYTVEEHFPKLSEFESSVVYPALIVPAKDTSMVRKRLQNLVLKKPKTKSVYNLEPDEQQESIDERKIVLVRTLTDSSNDTPSNLETQSTCKPLEAVFELAHLQELLMDNPIKYRRSQIELIQTYQDWTADQVLRKLLPLGPDEIPSSFEQVGHLAHLNLPANALPYKYIIGKVILDKNPSLKVVVNKTSTIQNEFRTFPMEVVAGIDKADIFKVKLKEGNCIFHLDFQQVYWNSRLQQEHARLVQHILAGTTKKRKLGESTSPKLVVVADVMAGVGPFAVPLTCNGRAGIEVHANDLNPASFQYLKQNSQVNKCRNLHTYNLDGRAFVHQMMDQKQVHHFILNLPATAVEFLDAFRGWTQTFMPTIHVYCFQCKDLDQARNDCLDRCQAALGGCRPSLTDWHLVRDVSPKKNMYCASFELPASVAELPRITLQATSITKSVVESD